LPRSFLGQSLRFYSAFVDYGGAVLKKEAHAGDENLSAVRPACMLVHNLCRDSINSLGVVKILLGVYR
jgi:hypothetical protein